MSPNSDLMAAFRDYATSRGLAAEFDDDDECVLQTPDGFAVEVRLDADGAGAVLVAPLGPWPPLEGDGAEALRTLLEANLLGVGSRGGLFAFDQPRDELVLYRRLPAAGIDCRRLEQLIDDLYMTARGFAEELRLDRESPP